MPYSVGLNNSSKLRGSVYIINKIITICIERSLLTTVLPIEMDLAESLLFHRSSLKRDRCGNVHLIPVAPHPDRALKGIPMPPSSLIGNSKRNWQHRTQLQVRHCFYIKLRLAKRNEQILSLLPKAR